jgi:hypothetical protein
LSIGDNNTQIAKRLGISEPALAEILANDPEHKDAHTAALLDRTPTCIQDVSDEAKELWKILVDSKAEGSAKQQALHMISEGGKREQQRLLLYGLVESHFDINGALKALRIPLRTFQNWIKTDPEFAELVSEVQDQKKAFVESRLFRLIAMGSERATIFGAERLLKEYSAKMEYSGSIEHNHQHNTGLDLSKLPVEVRSQIFEILASSSLVDPDGLLAETPTALDAVEVKRLN